MRRSLGGRGQKPAPIGVRLRRRPGCSQTAQLGSHHQNRATEANLVSLTMSAGQRQFWCRCQNRATEANLGSSMILLVRSSLGHVENGADKPFVKGAVGRCMVVQSIVVGILRQIRWRELRISNLQAMIVTTEESDDFRRLMDAVLTGDGEALASLFSLYRDRLRRMVELRMDVRLRGRVSASDILQESYIGALQRLPHYQASSDIPLFVWLRAVTMQRLIDVHRRHLGGQARDASREIRLGEVEAIEAGTGQIAELIANTTSPSLAARRGEIMAIVRDALEQLDAIDREVLVLRHFEQMSNHEAAAALEIKPAAASKRYVRAVERLKTVLEQIPGFEGGST